MVPGGSTQNFKMFVLSWTAAFAALVSAEQITTTFWKPNSGGTGKEGFYGSVVGDKDGLLTIDVYRDNSSNSFARDYRRNMGIYTVGPNLWERAGNFTVFDESTTNVYNQIVRCEKATSTDVKARCTQIMDPDLAKAFYCFIDDTTSSGERESYAETVTQTYGSGLWGGPGTETVTYKYVENERQPFCDDASALSSSVTYAYDFPRDENESMQVYRAVITAGEEKLSATAGAGVGTGSVKPTGTAANTGAAAKNSEGIAIPMKTAAPALAGMGVFAAAFFL